jgi:TRAP-type C4-dicarboxylate transport system substrate-binding protein
MRAPRRTILASGLAAAATFAAPATLRAQPAKMRLSHQYPPAHHIARVLSAFAEDVNARQAGIEIEVFPAEQLARVAENFPGVARGAFEAAVATNFTWGNTIPEMSAGDVPSFVEKRVRRAGDGDYAACGLWASAGGREDFRW